MRSQRFGIEIEMTGITRAAAAKVIAGYFDTTATHVGGFYDSYAVRDDQERQWKVMSDASIRAQTRRGNTNNSAYKVELVSPICRYEDIELLQEIIRKLRAAFMSMWTPELTMLKRSVMLLTSWLQKRICYTKR